MRTARTLGLAAGTVSVNIRYDDWKDFSAARSLPAPTQLDNEAGAAAMALLGRLHTRRVALRHMGVELSNFSRAAGPALLEEPADARRRQLTAAVDEIRHRYGHAAVVAGESIDLLGKLRQNDHGFVLRTPSLTK
jgi:DNA polymerase-4